MLRDGYQHGFPESLWAAAKDEGREAMIARARRRSLITYSDLVSEIKSIRFEPHDPRLFHFLGEISSDEDDAGRGLLTALVVHKVDMQPGDGFFVLAKARGRNTSDPVRFWAEELGRVYSVWTGQ